MKDSYLATMVRLAGEIADAYAASLFVVDGNVLRPYIIYNLPEEYIAGIGDVRVGTHIERNQHFAKLVAITLKGKGGKLMSSNGPVFVGPVEKKLHQASVVDTD
jgi:hypothetical protein